MKLRFCYMGEAEAGCHIQNLIFLAEENDMRRFLGNYLVGRLESAGLC